MGRDTSIRQLKKMIVCRVSKIGHGYFTGCPILICNGGQRLFPIPIIPFWLVDGQNPTMLNGNPSLRIQEKHRFFCCVFLFFCVEDIVVLDTTWVTPHLPISSEQWQSPTLLKSPWISAGNVHISLGQHHRSNPDWWCCYRNVPRNLLPKSATSPGRGASATGTPMPRRGGCSKHIRSQVTKSMIFQRGRSTNN